MSTHELRPERIDLETVRERLRGKRGKEYWRCLEELADTEEFRSFLEDEFPQQARPLRGETVDRRTFLTLSAASLAMAGLSGCRFLPQRKIVPYVQRPEEVVEGKPMFYATAITEGGYAAPVVATCREGRPIKLEGNPDHPASVGAADAVMQAALLNLYDPDRSQNVVNAGQIATWEDFLKSARTFLATPRSAPTGIRILTETVTSPTLRDQITRLQGRYAGLRWHQYEPTNRSNVYAGTGAAFGGHTAEPIYHFDRADRILSLDGDFLLSMPGHVRYANDYANRRRVRVGKADMNRLYVIESTLTITGAMADHRVPVKPSEVAGIARAIAAQLGVAGATAPATLNPQLSTLLPAMVRDLQSARGRAVVVPGDHQPAEVHALAHAMNAALGAIGSTVTYIAPVAADPSDQVASFQQLVSDMQAGRVQMLLIVGGNPVYTAPADLAFDRALLNVPFRAHLGLHEDETSVLCHWHLPATHTLEAWSDARAYDGTVSIVQPLIEPLYDARSPHEFLEAVLAEPANGLDIVRSYWTRTRPAADFDAQWEKILHDGFISGTAAPAMPVTAAAAALPPAATAAAQGIELLFLPDPWLLDGRYSNNPWLQELPRPITKLVWDNAAIMSAATAQRLHVTDFDVVSIQYKGRTIEAGVWVQPGQPDDVITLNFGYGRKAGGNVAVGPGVNVFPLRTADAPNFGSGATVQGTGDTMYLVALHMRSSTDMSGRDPVEHATLEEFRANAAVSHEGEEGYNPPEEDSMYSDARRGDHRYTGFGTYQWGMSIDNNVCIGCQACVSACNVENNIPMVGKDQVRRGREMQWLRVDRYYNGGLDNPRTFFEPVPCMHCENAPCEPVCPVGATVHSHEGLNMMVYNRCVGTRYCSNNCPYKVRRFNFYKFVAGQPNSAPSNYDLPIIKLAANPEVTVRGRGVMEKCSYCVQRIDIARIEAKKEGREIRDGEIQTACQQTCPTNAIVFGNILDANSQVAKLKAEPQDFKLLGDLNTRPRTTYLPRLTNPNPEITNGA